MNKARTEGAKQRPQRPLPTAADFLSFKQDLYKNYLHARHLERIDAVLIDAMRFVETAGAEGHGFHIIQMPPRHGKTVTISRLFPPFVLGYRPDWRFILASYGATLAQKNSRYSRNIVRSPLFPERFEGVELARDSKASDAWDIEGHEGGLDAMGVGGGVTGKGAQIIIVDDPVKSREEAESEVYREKVWDWYTDDLYTRREPNGAIIIVMCMTGDTPVLMADGTERPLCEINVGDAVATYDNGKLRTSTVLKHASNGHDSVYRIRTTSGKIVHANERHPFLVEAHGELTWIRLKNLTTAHKIVTVKGNGGNGKVKPAPLTVAIDKSVVEDTAQRTITRKNGLMDRVRHRTMRSLGAIFGFSEGTGLPALSTMRYLRSRMANALFASSRLETTSALTGAVSCALTTATKPTRSEHFCATTATSLLDTPRPKQPRSQLPNTSDFTTERIVSIDYAGIKEVFDVQIERTENYIANGFVSHNTRWHEDDLVGRLLKNEPGKWQVLRLPALAEADDPLGRAEGEALWAERFPVPVLRDIETTLGEYSFSALYQQHPVPAEGGIFKRKWFQSDDHPLIDQSPPVAYSVRYWDLAMSEKTSADYTAGVHYGVAADGFRYVLDVVHERIDWGDLTERLAQVILKDGPSVAQYIEQKGYMSRAIQALNIDPRFHGYQIFGVEVDKDKVTRALPAAAKASAGVVYVLNRQWTQAFLDELCSFPFGAHDDQVDAFAGAETAIGDSLNEAVGGIQYADNAISQSAY